MVQEGIEGNGREEERDVIKRVKSTLEKEETYRNSASFLLRQMPAKTISLKTSRPILPPAYNDFIRRCRATVIAGHFYGLHSCLTHHIWPFYRISGPWNAGHTLQAAKGNGRGNRANRRHPTFSPTGNFLWRGRKLRKRMGNGVITN